MCIRDRLKISNFWKSKMAAAAILKNHKNHDISVTVWPTFIKFGMLMQNMSINRSGHHKIRISQIQDGGRPPFWKPLNRHISATVWPILMKFGTMTHIGPYSGKTIKISNFLKFKMAAAATWKITKIAISPQWFDRSLRNLVCWCKMGLLTAPTVKNWISQIQDGGRPPF